MTLARTDTAKLCKDCKFAMREPTGYVCTQMQDVVTGFSPRCDDVRSKHSDYCGPDAHAWQPRMNASAIADTARFYVTRNGEREYIDIDQQGNTYSRDKIIKKDGTIVHKAPPWTTGNDRIDPNLTEWSRDPKSEDKP